MNIMNRDPIYLGKGIAILGVWIGWALAMKMLLIPVASLTESGSTALTVIGVLLLVGLYIGVLSVVISATSMILDRWHIK